MNDKQLDSGLMSADGDPEGYGSPAESTPCTSECWARAEDSKDTHEECGCHCHRLPGGEAQPRVYTDDEINGLLAGMPLRNLHVNFCDHTIRVDGGCGIPMHDGCTVLQWVAHDGREPFTYLPFFAAAPAIVHQLQQRLAQVTTERDAANLRVEHADDEVGRLTRERDAERERCAKIVEESELPDMYSEPALIGIAAAIRQGETIMSDNAPPASVWLHMVDADCWCCYHDEHEDNLSEMVEYVPRADMDAKVAEGFEAGTVFAKTVIEDLQSQLAAKDDEIQRLNWSTHDFGNLNAAHPCSRCSVTTMDDHAGYDCLAWLTRRVKENESQLAAVQRLTESTLDHNRDLITTVAAKEAEIQSLNLLLASESQGRASTQQERGQYIRDVARIRDEAVARAKREGTEEAAKECERFIDAVKGRQDVRADGAFVALTRLAKSIRSLAKQQSKQGEKS